MTHQIYDDLDKVPQPGLRFHLTCDTCGVFAMFRTVESAMWYAVNHAVKLHERCLSKHDDNKKISVIDTVATCGRHYAGRF